MSGIGPHGPDPSRYVSHRAYERDLERVFARSWHLVGHSNDVAQDGRWSPASLLPDSLDEPLLFTRQGGQIRAFANVCTHRAALLATAPGAGRLLECPYHGRCFGLDGRYKAALGFEGPQPDLHPVNHGTALNHLWANADDDASFDPVRDLLSDLAYAPWSDFVFDADDSRDYELDAPWAAYVENYLEGLHIPFVHPALQSTLDLADYRVETHPAGVVQVGVAAAGEPTLHLPVGHRLFGQRIAALYAWIFPTTIVNLYPWGASINLVHPLGPQKTRIRYLTWVGDAARRGTGAGADVHQTEREDQAVVSRVGTGLRSRWARPATYAPGYEDGVAWFHRLWSAAQA